MIRSLSDTTPMSPSSYTVLIVEHVAADRELYRNYLLADSSCHYTVLESTSAAAAMAVCRKQQIDGILVNAVLSDADGIEFVKALRRQFEDSPPPVVLVAGKEESASSVEVAVQHAVQAIKSGAEDYLMKQTLTPTQLQHAIQSAIKNGQLYHQLQHQEEHTRIQQLNRDLANRVDELQTLIDIIPVGIAIASDPSCAQMQCNAYMRQLLGVNPGHNISKSAPSEEQPAFRVFQNGEEIASENLPMQIAAQLGVEVRETEIEIRLPDGTACQLLSYTSPLRDDQNQIRGAIGAFLDITDRNRMAAELRTREATIRQQLAELESIYATAPVGLCFQDANLRYVRINDQLAEINGVPASEHLGRTSSEVLPELADLIEPLHRRVVETGEPVLNLEIHGMTKAQPSIERDWIASYYPLKDAYGRVLGLNVVVQDITELKQAQAERERLLHQLEMERSFLEQTLQQMPSGVAIAEVPSGKLLFHNDEAIRLLRHSMSTSDTYTGYTEYGALHADGQSYQPEEYPIARSVLSGEVVKAEDMCYRRGDGTETIFSVNAAPIIDQSGTRIAAVSTFEDIAERKQAERDRLLLAQIVESSSDAIIGFTLERKIISWNAAAERIFGYTAAEIIGQDWMVLVSADRADEPLMLFEATRQGRVVNQFETTRQRKDGSLVDVAVTVSPIKNARNEIIGVSGTMRDITKQKQLEQEREQLLAQAQSARAEAEAANRSKDEFVAMVAHELRSPLNAIMGWAKLLQTRQYDAVTTNKALETITRNTQVQVQLVEDLLDISRMVRGTLQLTIVPVDLVNVIEPALETMRPTAEAKQIQLETQIHNVASISGDFARLQQVVLNLLTNAIKFTPEAGQIQIVLDQLPTQVRLQVIDTGKGISQDFLPHIFERFCQDQHSTTTKQGLGLGLAIVKHIVELHAGTVTVESRGEGQGATFTVLLPLLGSGKVREQEERLPQASVARRVGLHDQLHEERTSVSINRTEPGKVKERIAPSPAYPLSDIRVLLVDDEPDILSLTALILEQHGAIAQTATSVISALERLPQFRPNVLLSDIAMPEQDGYELLRQMRMIHPEGQIPAIALTADASGSRREAFLQAGFLEHLTKPVEPEPLIAAILSAIGRRRP